MITVSNSLASLLTLPAIEPRFFVDIETGSGTWYVSNERLTWGGNSYQARLAGIPSVQTDLGPPGLVGPHDVTIDIANADGAWSQYRPEFFRGRTMTIKQGFREVDSEAVWAVKFKMTSARVVNPELFRIEAGDLLTDARRKLIPTDALLITRDIFPKIPEDSPGLGKPVPVGFGFALTPMYLVEEQASGIGGYGARFIARLAGPQQLLTGAFAFQLFNNEFSQVDGVSFATETLPSSVVVATIQQTAPPRVGGITELVPEYGYFAENLVAGTGVVYPDEALVSLLTNSYLAGITDSIVDSANWADAHSKWANTGITFNGALLEQRPLEAVLDDWAYAAHAHLIFRDKLRIVVQATRTAVYSFHAGNILQGTLTYRDVPLQELETTQVLRYQQVIQHYTDSRQVLDPFPRSTITYYAGSGATAEHESPFLGWFTSANEAVQRWARIEAAGVREYEFDSTVRAAVVEEGDLVTLVHTLYAPAVQLCQVTGMTRGELVHFRLRETSSLAMSVITSASGVYQHPLARTAYVRYGGGNQAVNATPVTFTTSHPLTMTPTLVIPRILPQYLPTTTSSLVSANNSQFAVAMTSTACYNATPNLQDFLTRV